MPRIPRILDPLDRHIRPRRVTVIHGPRRVGKTTLVEHYLESHGLRALRATGDDIMARALLTSQDASAILGWTQGYDLVFLDEAQRIPEVGWALKILVDARPELTIIATGSSCFALAGAVGEPLTGRQTPLRLFPINVAELHATMNDFELTQSLDDLLVYGMYPEVRTAESASERREVLRELASSYLLKDILELDRVKSAKTLVNLLTLIALQVGSQVSLSELAGKLGVDSKTVARYLDLFEKSHVLYSLHGFSRNLRTEMTKMGKYYFFDTGVLNAVLNNFNPLERRHDVGALWENFMIMERMKALTYAGRDGRAFFWRTHNQQEIDLLEDRDGQLYAYEFKWNPNRATSAPSAFVQAYPQASFETVTPKNFIANLEHAGMENESEGRPSG